MCSGGGFLLRSQQLLICDEGILIQKPICCSHMILSQQRIMASLFGKTMFKFVIFLSLCTFFTISLASWIGNCSILSVSHTLIHLRVVTVKDCFLLSDAYQSFISIRG